MTDLEKAGKIAAEAITFGEKLIKPDTHMLEIIEKVENKIIKLGGGLAFPSQISLNEIAAHYNCFVKDTTLIKDGDIAKLDIGVHVNGYIADTALTVDLGKNKELKKASEEALKEAIKMVQIGTRLCDIGKVVETTIKSYGFNPIRNLSGHALGLYEVHAGLSIPNYDNKDRTELEKGMIIAIEPFATSGVGLIRESKMSDIFRVIRVGGVRNQSAKEILKFLNENYKTLPFARRYLINKFGEVKVNLAIRTLEQEGMIQQYTQLIEKSNGLVSHAEHTLLIEDKVKVITER